MSLNADDSVLKERNLAQVNFIIKKLKLAKFDHIVLCRVFVKMTFRANLVRASSIYKIKANLVFRLIRIPRKRLWRRANFKS